MSGHATAVTGFNACCCACPCYDLREFGRWGGVEKLMYSTLIRGLAAGLIIVTGVLQAAEQPTILVMGATGRQGGAVVDELLSRGYAVRAMTRKPQGKEAQRLIDKGVTVVKGDYGDKNSILAAMDGLQRAFFYSGFSRDEFAEGQNVIDAARQSGIRHLIYSSGAAAAPEDGMQEAVKGQVELALRDSGVPFTVVRPVAFMENYRGQQKRTIEYGVIDSRAPDRYVCFIAIPDIGFLVGEAFDNPDEWLGRAENIAGDKMTMAELANTFGTVLGRDIEYVRKPLEEFLQSFPPPLRPLFRWYDQVGYSADVAGLRERYPNLMTLEQYLRATGWENWQPDQ